MELQFVGREEWGARRPRQVTERDPSTLSGVAVHWFGKPSAAASHDGCPALLRSVQATHMAPGGLGTRDGASDIAYNHAVCPHGVAYTLRGFGVQTGANGNSRANREYAAVVYMGGEKDGRPVTEEARPVLAEVIRLWQKRGAGPLVKPHGFFTGSTCPGPDLREWVDLVPHPWLGDQPVPDVPVEDDTPGWVMDFAHWRLALDGDPEQRPKRLPKRIPESAWEVAAQVDRIANLMGPQEAFLDWAEWRRQGAKKGERPRSAPATIPKSWWEALQRLEQIFKGVKTTKKPAATKPKPPVDDGPVTVQSRLLAPPRANKRTLERYLLSRQHGSYGDDEVRKILGTYVDTCKQAGLDPLLVVSQMVLETGNLMSHWSQPPRRNPAGIGVTGAPGAGISFSNWDKAVRAHVGRLLAYVLPAGEGTDAQKALIAEALKVRPLPDDRRGQAPTLKGLAGSWAMDKKYADKISGVANEIRQRAA
ncbi:MAG TPA: peptidoglycan recognition family protein [Solirubrobacteraceae bacterium]